MSSASLAVPYNGISHCSLAFMRSFMLVCIYRNDCDDDHRCTVCGVCRGQGDSRGARSMQVVCVHVVLCATSSTSHQCSWARDPVETIADSIVCMRDRCSWRCISPVADCAGVCWHVYGMFRDNIRRDDRVPASVCWIVGEMGKLSCSCAAPCAAWDAYM
jgi:hypothetical protein